MNEKELIHSLPLQLNSSWDNIQPPWGSTCSCSKWGTGESVVLMRTPSFPSLNWSVSRRPERNLKSPFFSEATLAFEQHHAFAGKSASETSGRNSGWSLGGGWGTSQWSRVSCAVPRAGRSARRTAHLCLFHPHGKLERERLMCTSHSFGHWGSWRWSVWPKSPSRGGQSQDSDSTQPEPKPRALRSAVAFHWRGKSVLVESGYSELPFPPGPTLGALFLCFPSNHWKVCLKYLPSPWSDSGLGPFLHPSQSTLAGQGSGQHGTRVLMPGFRTVTSLDKDINSQSEERRPRGLRRNVSSQPPLCQPLWEVFTMSPCLLVSVSAALWPDSIKTFCHSISSVFSGGGRCSKQPKFDHSHHLGWVPQLPPIVATGTWIRSLQTHYGGRADGLLNADYIECGFGVQEKIHSVPPHNMNQSSRQLVLCSFCEKSSRKTRANAAKLDAV